MIAIENQIETLVAKQEHSTIRVQTLGHFQVWRDSKSINPKDLGREAAIQLFQFLVTNRHRNAMHKEQIIDRIWMTDSKSGQQNFKVALHGINKVLEPDRKSRAQSQYILRQGVSYQLDLDNIWIDAEALDQFIALGNQSMPSNPELAKKAYREAVNLYHGSYLPNRLYEDWSTEERERLQLLVLSALISLSELLVETNQMESVRLTQQALQIDPTWEDAYRIQMAAYLAKGNRPMAIKTYQQCEQVLEEEFGIPPLPETRRLFEKIKGI